MQDGTQVSCDSDRFPIYYAIALYTISMTEKFVIFAPYIKIYIKADDGTAVSPPTSNVLRSALR